MRRVLITGGASGIGAATVARFQEDGCRVAALDINEAMLAASAADVKAVCDVADEASVAAAVESAVAELGGLDVVVTAAGIASRGSVVECTPQEFDRVMSVNLRGVFLTCRATIPHLRGAGGGAIVVVASQLGLVAALTVAVNHYLEVTGRRVFLLQWWDLASEILGAVEGPGIHAEEAETSLALAVGQRVLMDKASIDAWDRGEAVREAGHTWTSLGKYSLVNKGPGVVVPMDMLRDITPSGVVGDARRATPELGQQILDAIIPRIVTVIRDMTETAPA